MDLSWYIVSWITLPYYLTVIIWLYLFEKVVFWWLSMRYSTRLMRLGCADIFWAVGEKYHNLINVIMTLNMKDPNEDIVADIRDVLNRTIMAEPGKYQKLLSSLNTFLGYSFLLKEQVKADDIITVIDIEKTKYSSMKELMFSYSYKPLPQNNKLMVEIIVIKAPKAWKESNDFKENQIPLMIRINHTVADGLSVMNLCAHTLGENDVNLENSLKNIPKSPEWQLTPAFQLLQKIYLFFMVPGFLIVRYFQGEATSVAGQEFEGPKSAHRQNISYRTEKPGENLVQKVKDLKKQIGDTSFSEIILTAVSASLYNYYEKALFKIPKSVKMAIVATKDLQPLTVNGVPQLRNQFGMVNFELPIKIDSDSILARLQVLKTNTRKLYDDPSELILRNYITFNLLKIMPLPLIKRVLPINGIASVISNLPEFPKIIIFNGHEVEDAYFFTLQRDQMATGFAVISYDHRLHLGFVGDVASVPTQADCDGIVDEFFNAIQQMQTESDKKRLNIS
ncbi:uncharacterized protein LOC114333819 [Diabrotica virgifera virgifera]|uniref:O-acyltransferase WSD1 C-terminal domain-containing protein n=1 Tax=Diabrotica virgifera virgifera TaxID=50390 RepID=A0ABM5IRE7_DIAVI|nr:uncharacterized protein LOC114333819 [Diabrotica virgifera virgifera]